MKIKNIICIICFLIFAFLSYLVITGNDITLDTLVYNFISKFISIRLTSLFKILTNIGSALVLIIIILLTFIFIKNKKYSLYMSINLIIITIIQIIFKNIFTRGRPINISLIEEDGYSYPSGHSLTSIAFYGLIIYFIYNSNLSKKFKILLTSFLTLLIILIGLSRIYLGVHYTTDVFGGFTLGISYIILFTNIIEFDFNNGK